MAALTFLGDTIKWAIKESNRACRWGYYWKAYREFFLVTSNAANPVRRLQHVKLAGHMGVDENEIWKERSASSLAQLSHSVSLRNSYLELDFLLLLKEHRQ